MTCCGGGAGTVRITGGVVVFDDLGTIVGAVAQAAKNGVRAEATRILRKGGSPAVNKMGGAGSADYRGKQVEERD